MANEYLNNKTFETVIELFKHAKRKKARFELIIADLQQTHERRQAKYGDEIRKPSLDTARAQYDSACAEFSQFQQELAISFYLLSENIANYAKFPGIDPDDAIQEGVLICFEKVDKFNPSYRGKSGQKAKAFNYMTTCILNHYRQLYRGVRNYAALKKKYGNFLHECYDSVIIVNGKERSAIKAMLERESSSL